MKKVLFSFVLALAAGITQAQDFPAQPIRIVIPYAAGGGNDLLARPVGSNMAERLKQPVVIENKPGASGNIGAQVVAQANADGYTLLMANISHTINPFIYKNPGYDLTADFAPISLIGTSPTIIVVHKSMPATSLREFVTHAQQNSGKLNFGSAGVGTPPHLAALLFSKLAGIKLVHIPYKGSAPLATALLQREIDVIFATPPAVAPYIKSGDFRALAVTSRTRVASYPNVPTVAESGLTGLGDFQMEVWWGLLAPARTDPRVLDTLHAAVTAAVRDPKMSERWLADGVVPTTTSRVEFQALIKSDLQKWEKVVRENAITLD